MGGSVSTDLFGACLCYLKIYIVKASTLDMFKT
uniref:Uncharacterized protein n=1 Tax=Arundo donax TaxID=35708 RepID=A0A0A9AU76_ARUDO